MGARAFLNGLFAAVIGAVLGAVLLSIYAVEPAQGGADDPRHLVATIAVVVVLAVLGGGVFALEWLLLRPQRHLARSVRAAAESRRSTAPLELPRRHALGELVTAIDALGGELSRARTGAAAATAQATAEIDEQKAWLEAILQALSEGVLVCDRQHRLLLYNQAALELLGRPAAIGLGRSVLEWLSGPALKHNLARLEHRYAGGGSAAGDRTAPFVCSGADAQGLYHGRMALIDDGHGAVKGYLLTLEDIAGQVRQTTQREAVYRALSRDLRGVVGNLRAAAEAVAGHPEMAADQRAAFDRVLIDESARLSRSIDELADRLAPSDGSGWPLAELYLADLARCLEERLADLPQLRVEWVGEPLWIYGDSLTLVQVFDCLIRQIHAEYAVERFELEALLGDRRVYVDLRWRGEVVAATLLDGWLERPCGEEPSAGRRLIDALDFHGCEPWSQAGRRAGEAVLRLPLLAPERPQFAEPVRAPLPARPEFYDFKLLREPSAGGDLAERPLSELSCVVFDCEMTGLDPEGGDEIISIAGVRVVNGRVLTGESFDRLIDPGRPIPPSSIRFHGLTDEAVRGEPRIEQVLPEFHRFVGESVLVAHNAAFDIKFLSMKESASGVRFTNPVLDTLLLSVLLDGEEADHSLDALCRRYGVLVAGRHTALGDTLGTAELLVRLLERLEARGYRTFGEITQASRMAAELRQRAATISNQGSH